MMHIILYIPVLLDRLFLLLYVTQTYFVWHFSPSPPPFSVLFKLGESVHLTCSVPGNRSTFFHPLTGVTMTTLNNRQRRGRMMSQSTNERSDDGGPGGEWWEMGREEEKGKKETHSTWKWGDWIPPSVAHKWSTRMYDFNAIFENSIQFFLCPFSKEQKPSTQKTAHKLSVARTWVTALGQLILHCD